MDRHRRVGDMWPLCWMACGEVLQLHDYSGELTDEMPGRQHVKVVVPFIDLHHFDADARVYELKQLLQSDDRVRLPFELLIAWRVEYARGDEHKTATLGQALSGSEGADGEDEQCLVALQKGLDAGGIAGPDMDLHVVNAWGAESHVAITIYAEQVALVQIHHGPVHTPWGRQVHAPGQLVRDDLLLRVELGMQTFAVILDFGGQTLLRFHNLIGHFVVLCGVGLQLGVHILVGIGVVIQLGRDLLIHIHLFLQLLLHLLCVVHHERVQRLLVLLHRRHLALQCIVHFHVLPQLGFQSIGDVAIAGPFRALHRTNLRSQIINAPLQREGG
mmetsp:Transcript_19934/g.34278  ORF Transcript_19934/g.34278 Transcript_19934/m.34278 type:complete len:330 (+) Transcript_19934:555-1544(+)